MRAPWEITPEMVLSISEVDRLLEYVQRCEVQAAGSDDSKAIIAAVADRLIIEGLMFSGLRCSEYCALTIEDTSIGQGRSVFRVRGKRGAERTVCIPARVSELVRRYATISGDSLGTRERHANHERPLILNERGRPYERTGLYRRVVAILNEAGLGSKASVQLLRHTYGYLAYLRTGGNLLFVQRQLGHAHPMVTAVYADLVRESYADFAEAIVGSPPVRAPAKRRSARSARGASAV